jgi:hypothetical protein
MRQTAPHAVRLLEQHAAEAMVRTSKNHSTVHGMPSLL